MKKKVFFVLSSLRAGGSERVYWLLSQHFDKSQYEVFLVLLDSSDAFFSTEISNVNVVDLKTVKASRSFFKLYQLIRQERPYAIFTTGGHISGLLALISLFVKIPVLIGRESSVMELMVQYLDLKAKIADKFVTATYRRMHIGVCQSEEIRNSLQQKYRIPKAKLVVIPNPVVPVQTLKESQSPGGKRIIIVARLGKEKGYHRLLQIFRKLPREYTLTIAGDGPLKEEIQELVRKLKLQKRIRFAGQVANVTDLIARHDLTVLTSFTEGFPNVVIESLSVGIPVVTFRVSAVSSIIKDGFNGYVIEQDDIECFRNHVRKACQREWDHRAIKEDVITRYGIEKVVSQYQMLVS